MNEVPMLFDVEQMVHYFAMHCDEVTLEQVRTAGSRLGRNQRPTLVCELAELGLLDDDVLTIVVPEAWSAVEWPNRALEASDWRWLFERAGYTVDGTPAPRPTSSLQLWRGALADYRGGWSWTDDLALAQWFAHRLHNAGAGRVFRATVEPWRLRARITQERAGESEWVVDTEGLPIEVVADGG